MTLDWFDLVVLVPFLLATCALAVYGLHLYVLLWLLRRRRCGVAQRQAAQIEKYRADTAEEGWPVVTTQLPIFNERDVADRVLRCVAKMDYPRDKHEIQVLDDSNDETREIIDRAAAELCAAGVDVKVVRRADRKDFKAGALAHAMGEARGEFISIFDADFLPPRDFLRRAIPLLVADEGLACLQGRWGHVNRDESWMTEAQALGIDGHFVIEQGARAWNGFMMNFNGTAGVWRRAAIEDPEVGGWSGDTLTEDLDLSYRAQLCGWRIDYCLDLECPAELPNTIEAFKSQQRRWATGSIQVARKLLPRIWSARLPISEKIEATIHLTHYTVSLWMVVSALVAWPLAIILYEGRFVHDWFWALWIGIGIAAIAPSMVYTYARYALGGGWSGLLTIPRMLTLGCGMCANNTLAVIRGLFERGGEFVRTPKSGSTTESGRASSYRMMNTRLWVIEILLGIYSLVSFFIYLDRSRGVFSVFLLLYAFGFLRVGWESSPFAPRDDGGGDSSVRAPIPVASGAASTESGGG